MFDSARIDIDGNDPRCGRGSQSLGEHTGTGTDLEHMISVLQLQSLHDGVGRTRIR
jgi:hypothetical protein